MFWYYFTVLLFTVLFQFLHLFYSHHLFKTNWSDGIHIQTVLVIDIFVKIRFLYILFLHWYIESKQA